MDEEIIKELAKALTHACFRNGIVEDLHSKWACLTDENMTKLNKDIYNRIFSVLYYFFFGSDAEKDKLLESIKVKCEKGYVTFEVQLSLELNFFKIYFFQCFINKPLVQWVHQSTGGLFYVQI